jgi:hypothetical protein
MAARPPLLALAGVGLVLALAGCGAPGPGSLTSLPRTVQVPFPDTGERQRIPEIRHVVVSALSAEVDAYRHTDAAGGLTAAQRVAEVAAFEAAPLAAGVAEGPPLTMPTAFAGAEFRPVRWEGVAVRDGLAKAYVVGHDLYRTLDDGASRGPASQVQLLLRRDATAPHGWRVVAEAAVADERVASVDPLPDR